MDNKNWITKLAEKNPSPALVAGMIVVIMSLAGVAPFLFYENKSLSNRLNSAFSDGTTAGRISADSAWAPIVKAKNTELLAKDRKIDTLEKTNREWIERYILFINATADSRINDLKSTLAKSEQAKQEAERAASETKTILRRGKAVVNKLENLNEKSNEN